MKENGFKLTKERSRRYPAETITDADYVDDIALLANEPTQAEFLLHSLERAAVYIGLHVNAHKTEYMCFNQRGDVSTLNSNSETRNRSSNPDQTTRLKKRKRNRRILDVVTPTDHRVKTEGRETKDKFLDLARELRKLWWDTRVTDVRIIIICSYAKIQTAQRYFVIIKSANKNWENIELRIQRNKGIDK